MWEGLRQTGADKLDNPTVLEPSAGSGRFLEMQPRDMDAQSNRVEVEPNPLTYSLQVFWDALGRLPEGFTADSQRPLATLLPHYFFTLLLRPVSWLVRFLPRGEKTWSYQVLSHECVVSLPSESIPIVNRIIYELVYQEESLAHELLSNPRNSMPSSTAINRTLPPILVPRCHTNLNLTSSWFRQVGQFP